jgi:hypothetical protein
MTFRTINNADLNNKRALCQAIGGQIVSVVPILVMLDEIAGMLFGKLPNYFKVKKRRGVVSRCNSAGAHIGAPLQM